jgi:hypothetical protein
MSGTTINEIPVENFRRLVVEHQAWIQHPTTQLLLAAFDNQEKSIVNCLVKDIHPDKKDAAYQHGIELKALREFRRVITDGELFVARATQR